MQMSGCVLSIVATDTLVVLKHQAISTRSADSMVIACD